MNVINYYICFFFLIKVIVTLFTHLASAKTPYCQFTDVVGKDHTNICI